jgi:hypothetical protein
MQQQERLTADEGRLRAELTALAAAQDARCRSWEESSREQERLLTGRRKDLDAEQQRWVVPTSTALVDAGVILAEQQRWVLVTRVRDILAEQQQWVTPQALKELIS